MLRYGEGMSKKRKDEKGYYVAALETERKSKHAFKSGRLKDGGGGDGGGAGRGGRGRGKRGGIRRRSRWWRRRRK